MARTLAEVDAALAVVEGRLLTAQGVVQAHTARLDAADGRLDAAEAFGTRLRVAWQLLRTGRLRGVEDGDEGELVLQPRLSRDKEQAIAFIARERNIGARRGRRS